MWSHLTPIIFVSYKYRYINYLLFKYYDILILTWNIQLCSFHWYSDKLTINTVFIKTINLKIPGTILDNSLLNYSTIFQCVPRGGFTFYLHASIFVQERVARARWLLAGYWQLRADAACATRVTRPCRISTPHWQPNIAHTHRFRCAKLSVYASLVVPLVICILMEIYLNEYTRTYLIKEIVRQSKARKNM